MKNILYGVLAGALFVLLIIATISSMDKSAKIDCPHWQNQATQYSGFYLTKWQAEQCKSVNIIVNAPIL